MEKGVGSRGHPCGVGADHGERGFDEEFLWDGGQAQPLGALGHSARVHLRPTATQPPSHQVAQPMDCSENINLQFNV